MDKRELRKTMKQRNLSLSAAEREAASELLVARLERLGAFARARTVALFAPLPDEPDVRRALARWCGARRLALPRVEGDAMRFFLYDPATMRRGAFGIDEPGPGAVECPPSEIDIVVVPGVAFTAAGDRLGRGRGYYDRYLSQRGMRAVRVGVCYAHQLVAALPVEPHDVRMACVVTS
ncbi:5-formyltetrahydrofolate cyclo-ligase [uncultured Alistipes sp.]|uniref:5-formyltetrahydrofolate cyclo-ligase n=1 Tax=uncultured Alistipes sp. TaxID=538949 RepID=UPI0026211885|nr:5-formyltetrahydrofolate cyclo-ligase [uncultured Alistipes sp.]